MPQKASHPQPEQQSDHRTGHSLLDAFTVGAEFAKELHPRGPLGRPLGRPAEALPLEQQGQLIGESV